MKIDPLDKTLRGNRYLNDRGIKQAIDFGFLTVTPDINFKKDGKRLQPGTLDLKIKRINETMPLSSRYPSDLKYTTHQTTLQARSANDVLLTEQIQHHTQIPEYHNMDFIFPFVDGRSSVRRLGAYVPHHGGVFMNTKQGVMVELDNYSQNDLIFAPGERVVQAFFRIDLFKAEHLKPHDLDIGGLFHVKWSDFTTKNLQETFEKARTLDMGIEITTNEQLRWLLKEGYLEVTPDAKIEDGYLLVHASKRASTINKIDGGIVFAKREDYKDKIRSPLNITNGYQRHPEDHIDIETVELFKLSEHVGIHFYNNPQKKLLQAIHKGDFSAFGENLNLTRMIDGWVDPCYEGPFSRQPKWSSQELISPGDVIGYGKIIFYPNGVDRGYGSAALGSQYHHADATAISK